MMSSHGNADADDDTASEPAAQANNIQQHEDICPICIMPYTEPSVLNACQLQWAEYKRLCPLCKRQFTAILHHITSDKEFMTFSLPEWKDDPNKARGQQSISTLRTLPARGIYRPPAARVGPASQARLMATASRYGLPDTSLHVEYMRQLARRRDVYRRRVRAHPVENPLGRYGGGPNLNDTLDLRTQPLIESRLRVWLKRELEAILDDIDVGFITAYFLGVLKQHGVNTPHTQALIRDLLGDDTDIFIHEAQNFIRSEMEMHNYDRLVRYDGDSPMASYGRREFVRPSSVPTIDLDNEISSDSSDEDTYIRDMHLREHSRTPAERPRTPGEHSRTHERQSSRNSSGHHDHHHHHHHHSSSSRRSRSRERPRDDNNDRRRDRSPGRDADNPVVL